MSDSRLDLFNRRLKEQSARLRSRAVELIPKGLRTPKVEATSMEYDEGEGDAESRDKGRYKQDVEREVDRIKVKVSYCILGPSGEKLMSSSLLRSLTCRHRGDLLRLSSKGRKSVCHPLLLRSAPRLINSFLIRCNVPHFHLSVIWYGPGMASIRIYCPNCFLLAIENMDIQAKAVPLLPLRVRPPVFDQL